MILKSQYGQKINNKKKTIFTHYFTNSPINPIKNVDYLFFIFASH